MTRKTTKKIKIGNTEIGGLSSVKIQSMLNVHHSNVEGNVEQAVRLEKAGCEIVRVAIPNAEAVKLIPSIKKEISIPLVADIHFDYKLALLSCENGIDKIRINPGNIGNDDRVKEVVNACKSRNIPIRIGVNSGSVEKHILEKYKSPTPRALCESAMYHVNLLEKFDFTDIAISIKSSDVVKMIEAYELMSEMVDYPLHLGVTEAGTAHMGLVKSAVGIGSLLAHGIGDTIRVSLTADPVEEIAAAKDILKSLGMRKGIKFVSCPTCGRTSIDLIGLASKVEKALENCEKDITVAIMGCEVNGPGEAKEADIGVAGGKGIGLIFKKGQILKRVNEDELLGTLLEEVEKL